MKNQRWRQIQRRIARHAGAIDSKLTLEQRQDVVQAVTENLLKSSYPKEVRHPKVYLMTVTRNTLAKQANATGRQQKILKRLEEHWSEHTARELFDLEEEVWDVLHYLRRYLKPGYFALLIAPGATGLSNAELSSRLGMPLRTLERHIANAKQQAKQWREGGL